jgi:hypothetical protein
MANFEAWFQIWDMDLTTALPQWKFLGWAYGAPCLFNEVWEGRFIIHNADGSLYDADRECVRELAIGGPMPDSHWSPSVSV